MIKSRGRREFFRTGRAALVAISFATRSPGAVPGTDSSIPTDGQDYYDKLGVTKIINAAGTYTALTASTMPPSVQAAVTRAAKHPVRLHELQPGHVSTWLAS